MSKLTPKQELFAQTYIKTGNASEAYREAYDTSKYTEKSINEKASQFLKHVKIKSRIEELKKQLEKKHDITKDKILNHLCNIAFLDINSLADKDGNIKNINDLDEDTRKVLQGAEFKTLGSGALAKTTLSYRLSDKLKAIEMINKMLGYNEPDKIEHSGEITQKVKTLDDFYEE